MLPHYTLTSLDITSLYSNIPDKDMTQATTDNGLRNVREAGTVCVLPKTNNNEILVSRMQRKVCATPCFEVYHTTLHFWGSIDTKMEKRNTQSQ
jgi:hypothetical protein